MMITSYKIGNFKAFSETRTIPLKPITLIYGANSSGKSSLIHSMLLAYNGFRYNDLDMHQTNISGDSVNLGGFRQYVYNRDVEKQVTLSISFKSDSINVPKEISQLAENFTIQYKVGIQTDDQGNVAQMGYPEVKIVEVYSGEKLILTLMKSSQGLTIKELDLDFPLFDSAIITTLQILGLTGHNKLRIKNLVPNVLHRIPLKCQGLSITMTENIEELINAFFKYMRNSKVHDKKRSTSVAERTIEDALRTFLSVSLSNLIVFISSETSMFCKKFKYLGPLRSYPPRHIEFSKYNDPNWYSGGIFAWDIIRKNEAIRSKINDWLMNTDRMKTPYKLIVREMVNINDVKKAVDEWVENIDSNHVKVQEITDIDVDVDRDGTMYPYEHPVDYIPCLDNIQGIGEECIELLKKPSIDRNYDLIIFDQRTKTYVTHRDIGVGISQILPILAYCYSLQGNLIAIEQPEIHLHPAMQSELGDVIIESALGDKSNQLIIESHSEHILLRIMKRIKQSFYEELPHGMPRISPSDVCILFVEPIGTSSVIHRIELDEEGRMITPWPGGFFEEGFRERFL